jgi:vancomycin permeability regulator SanA
MNATATLLLAALIVLAIPAFTLLAIAAAMRLAASRRIRAPLPGEKRPVAVVLGAKILEPGVPTSMLADRLDLAAEMIALGTVERLLVTGDGAGLGPDEVETMLSGLAARGVPAEKMLLDRQGIRTLTSMVHARDTFGLKSVFVITNPFHCARAVFLASRVGLDAIAVPAYPRRPLLPSTRVANWLRERAAQARALWDVLRGRAR